MKKFAITNKGVCFYCLYEKMINANIELTLIDTVEKTIQYETSKFIEQTYLTTYLLKQKPKEKNKVTLREIFKVFCESIDFANEKEANLIHKQNQNEINRLSKKHGSIKQNALQTMLSNKCII